MKRFLKKLLGAESGGEAPRGQEAIRLRESVLAGFPPTITFPEDLGALCDWQEANEDSSIGDFEVCPDDGDDIYCWFDSHAADSRLARFGTGPDGALYCIWLQEDGRQPIVHLGSEGNDLRVLAGSMQEFMILLAIGYGAFEVGNHSEPPSDPGIVDQEFRSWVEDRFSSEIPGTGIDISRRAASEFDDFESFVLSIEGD